MANNMNYDKILEMLSKRTGTDPSQLQSIAKSGSVDDIMRKMNPEDVGKIQNILQNKSELEKIINSSQAQAIIKKLTEGK